MPNLYNYQKQVFTVIMFLCFSLFIKAQPPTISFEAVPLGGDLSAPVDIVTAEDGTNRLFIVQQAGIIRVWDGITLKQFADLGATGANLIAAGGERGLLSLAFHPGYDGVTNRFFFVYYTATNGDITVRRFQTATGNPDTVDAASGAPILSITHPAGNHNGGKLNFGRDGYLYFATGDGGGGNDTDNNAQTGTVLLGKMLRLNIDTITTQYGNYGVPSSNPYIGDPAIDDRIWALGLRNPFRWSFDRLNGNMWIGDVGQGAQEEVSFRPAGFTGHVNYGWRCFEGYPSTPGVPDCTPVDYVPPVFDYPNPGAGPSAVTGGYVYRGNEFPNFRGYYIAADVYSGEVFLLWPGATGFDSATQATSLSFIVGFGEGEDGTLYAVSQGTDSLYKVVATGGVVLPVKLSSFIGSKKNGFNELKWITAFESNTARFHIEYSKDGRTYERIGIVAASRNTNGGNYNFNHYLSTNHDVFYRLGIEEDNGTVQYSSVVKLDGTKQNGIRVYPTVIHNNMFNLEVFQNSYSLRIINTNGSVMFKKDLEGITGSMTIYLPKLTKGMYIAEVIGEAGSVREKILIQ